MSVKTWSIFLALLLPAALAERSNGASFTLEALMSALAEVESVDAAFREIKEVPILDEPITLTGVLRYRAPDYVKKQVLLPQRESIEISGDELYISSAERGQHRLWLHDYPGIGAFVTSFRATLAGDIDSLTRYWRVDLNGGLDRWRLRLEPIDETIAEQVESILIKGRQRQLLRIDTRQTDGSRSVMTITPSKE
jgi:hypothetical protein